MGYTMLTIMAEGTDLHELRYTEWVHFPGPSNDWKPRWDENYGIELYNHTDDPAENENIYFSDSVDDAIKSELRRRLHAGWPM